MNIAERIGAEIEGRIASGEWKPGHRIPFEHELVTQYGCARATVGKALTALVRAGLLERRRKAGTFVAYPHVQSAVLDIPDIGKAIAERTGSYRFDLLTSDIRNDDGHSGNFPSGTRLRHVTGIHQGQDGPFAFEDRLISLDSVPEAADRRFHGHIPQHMAHPVSALDAGATPDQCHRGQCRGQRPSRHTAPYPLPAGRTLDMADGGAGHLCLPDFPGRPVRSGRDIYAGRAVG